MSTLKRTFGELRKYPSAVAGLVIIVALIGLSIYTLFAIPYQQAIRLWRGGEEIWYKTPRNAQPIWVNWLTRAKLPETLAMNSRDNPDSKISKEMSGGMRDITISFPFDYYYDGFPQELSIYFNSTYIEKNPFVSVYLYTPDGREVRLGDFAIKTTDTYRISQDSKLITRLGNLAAEKGLFRDVSDDTYLVPLKGQYELRISALTFEDEADVEAEFVMYGQVHGLAGTDNRRRDLMVALLWGTPVALAFGLLAAVGTTITTMIIAAVGVWFGGWIDEAIQRVTEVNLILPVLPILIMIGTFYSRSIWLILGVVVLLSIFGTGIKSYRAIFIQVVESPYIEAAKAYGASNWRIILNYLIPRIIPVLIPSLVTLIPSYVFLEASLSVLGLGDPVLPTWGKIIDDARANGALYQGQYYWVLEPAVLLMVTGFAFAMVGFALDRIFNPRLRGL